MRSARTGSRLLERGGGGGVGRLLPVLVPQSRAREARRGTDQGQIPRYLRVLLPRGPSADQGVRSGQHDSRQLVRRSGLRPVPPEPPETARLRQPRSRDTYHAVERRSRTHQRLQPASGSGDPVRSRRVAFEERLTTARCRESLGSSGSTWAGPAPTSL